MRQVTIRIPDAFYKTFMDFFKHIPDAKVEQLDDLVIPEWHKKETLKRLKTSKKEDFTSWSAAKKELKKK